MTGTHPDVVATAFPVVGVGASAGGLEAFGLLLGALPTDTGMAFVLVQHLDPNAASALAPLLGHRTAMPVTEVLSDLVMEPDHVYVIAPNTTLVLEGGNLRVEPRGEGRHLPIDRLFASLADQRPGRTVGIVLSGTGSDGTNGLEAIRAAGGLTFAQDEASAAYPDMPRSAVRTGCVDSVMAPDAIGREFAELRAHPLLSRPGVAPAPPPPEDVADDAQHLAAVLGLLRTVSGVDFSAYRPSTLRRRIDRRVVLTRSASLADYAAKLAETPDEVEALYHDCLIHVTSFFRDPATFLALRDLVFPKLVEDRPADSAIRVWVPGCSTGQEAYSLAMVLLEFLAERGLHHRVQIFATDLSEEVALKRARDGRYPETIDADVSAERLERFFVREDDGFRVGKELRSTVVFARQDVGGDPPFSHMDLVSCRNLLIYLSPALQRRVIATFHFALEPGGFLLLGTSETVGGAIDLFEAINPEHRIYAKRPSERRHPWFPAVSARARGSDRAAADVSTPDWRQEADRIVLTHWGPPGVLVDSGDRVLQYRGDTSPFLTAAPGDPSSHVLRTLREGLFEDVDSALRECRRTAAPVVRTGATVLRDGRPHAVDLLLFPVTVPGTTDRCVLVVFDQPRRDVAPAARAMAPWSWLRTLALGLLRPATRTVDVGQLGRELSSTRAYLQSVIDRQDAVNEILASANEEAVSGNEELQSTNEELETAKEELQSLNEELTTVNEQLQERNGELTRLSDDLVNLLESAAVPMVALDRELRIRRFTPAAGRAFHLIPSDVGRPMVHLRTPVEVDDLEDVGRTVLATGAAVTREIRDDRGMWYALRVHPYKTTDGEVDGAVLVLADIDAAKRVQASIADARDQARAIVETVQDPLLELDGELRIVSANAAFYRYHRLSAGSAEGEALGEVAGGVWADPELEAKLGRVLRGELTLEDHAFRKQLADGTTRVGRLDARRIVDRAPERVLLAVHDETEQHRLTAQLQRQAVELDEASGRKNDFLATLAHELRNPLTPIRNALAIRALAGATSDAARQADEMMVRQVHHLTRLVDDLLDVSRISLGRIELRPQTVDLCRAVADVVDLEQEDAHRSGQQISVHDPGAPVWIRADPVRVDQIVANLVTNAVKYTNSGGRIDITISTDDGDAVLEVSDDGVGISASMLPRVWDLFAQGEQPIHRTRGGIGVGLSLVRNLVELHGGRVAAASEGLSRGSRFTVRLPLSLRPPEREAEGAGPKGEHVRRRILVVDDDHDIASSLGLLLGLMGHEVRVATDEAAALSAAEEFRPEVALVDIGLGRTSGLDLGRKLREDPHQLGVTLIALTGYGSDEDRARSLAAGFDLHLVKPVDADLLDAILSRPDAQPPPV